MIGTIFFISGWITLMQTIVGDRLPIIQVCAYIDAVVLQAHLAVCHVSPARGACSTAFAWHLLSVLTLTPCTD